MKLLLITQAVDKTDPNLGFFHAWILKLAAEVEHLYVICLRAGEYDLPSNVTVLSLGKEKKESRAQYLLRFYHYIFQYRKNYQSVLVHMNPEYVVLGGLFWRVMRKKIGLWYVHKSVDLKLRIAEKMVTKIFTTSPESFRLRTKKISYLGHGINMGEFKIQAPDINLVFLSASRITSSKHLDTIVQGLAELKKNGLKARLEIAGAPITTADKVYLQDLKQLVSDLGLDADVIFLGGLDRLGLVVALARSHLLIHASSTGSTDKIVLEALASGRPVITSSEAYQEEAKAGFVEIFKPENPTDLAEKIIQLNKAGKLQTPFLPRTESVEYIRKHHNLDTVIKQIINYFTV